MSENGLVIKYQELEREDGSPPRSFTFRNIAPIPLGYEQLKNARTDSPLTVRMDWTRAEIIETDIPDLDVTKGFNIGGTIESPFSANVIGLVRGGWIPPSFIDPGTLILLDRNVITEIVSRFDGGALKGRDPDFIDLFADAPLELSPMLAVMEGAQRQLPSLDHATDQLNEIVQKLARALPKAKIMAGAQNLVGALGLIEEGRTSFEASQAFLVEVAKLMPDPVAHARKERVWKAILSVADRHGISRRSTLLLAVLSALTAPNGGPCARILKFRASYTNGDAYNAIADLRAIEMLFNFLTLHPGKPVQLCTADRNLALFWVGMGAHTFTRTDGPIDVDFSFEAEVLPAWAAEWWRNASPARV